MRLSRRIALLATLVACLGAPSAAGAVGLQSIGSFEQPIFVTSDPSSANRLFVVEREGRIKLVSGGTTTVFADITAAVRCCDGERGLFSVALAPDFPTSGLLYVFYTGEDGPGNLHIAELRAGGAGAPASSLRNLLTIPHSAASNHNGGQLQFGPDGLLYAATGDGGSTPNNGQSLTSLLGKVLRIDPAPGGGQPYTIPAGNPFAGGPGADEIWAYGLRNPWRFSFDRQTGDLLLTDVGQSTYEEVNFAPSAAGLGRGANFGWNCREAAHPYAGAPGTCVGFSGFTDPVFEYANTADTCSVTGGYVVRDPTLGDAVGRYLYADLCAGQIRSFVPGFPAVAERFEAATVQQPVSFGEDACGRLYVVERAAQVFRLTGSGTPACKVLTVRKRGRGIVRGPGIKCPPDCTQVFPLPQQVTLRARARGRASFIRWRRACAGKGNCTVRMNADRTVGARFRGPLKTLVRLTASDRSVAAGARASLRVRARPCKGRRGDRVSLLRDGRRVAVKRLSRRCLARFHPRVGDDSAFRAKVRADRRHRAGKSAPLRIRTG